MQCPCCRARSPYGGDLAPGSPVSLDLSASGVCVVQRHVPWDSAPACSRDLALPASSWDTWHFEEVQHQGAGGNLSVRCRTVPPVFSLVLFLCCPLLRTSREDHQIHVYVIQAGRRSAFLVCVWDVLKSDGTYLTVFKEKRPLRFS